MLGGDGVQDPRIRREHKPGPAIICILHEQYTVLFLEAQQPSDWIHNARWYFYPKAQQSSDWMCIARIVLFPEAQPHPTWHGYRDDHSTPDSMHIESKANWRKRTGLAKGLRTSHPYNTVLALLYYNGVSLQMSITPMQIELYIKMSMLAHPH